METFFIKKPERITDETYLDRCEQLRWSGNFLLPDAGQQVRVTMNNIGLGIVVGYFSSHGYVGCMVLPVNPPEWLVSQNKADKSAPYWRKANIACIFGAEMVLL
jgi:hypothetical protein